MAVDSSPMVMKGLATFAGFDVNDPVKACAILRNTLAAPGDVEYELAACSDAHNYVCEFNGVFVVVILSLV